MAAVKPICAELSEKQQRIARLLIVSLRTNYSASDQKIKSTEIIKAVRARGFTLHDAELRQIIGYIRRQDLCAPGFILSDGGGYWYSEDENEMQQVWASEYGRALNILHNFKPLHRRFKHLQGLANNLFHNT